MTKFKEETNSLDAENVENLTNNMKTVCPTLDNLENISNMESSSENIRDIDDKDLLSNDNYNDKVARKPVESWKYLTFKSEDSRTSYKCSACTSVYQHKKSLNKHWKDKHLYDNGSMDVCSNNSANESQLNIMNSQVIDNLENRYKFPTNSDIPTNVLSPIRMTNSPTLRRKRSSFCLQPYSEDNENENMPPLQSRPSSLFQFSNISRASSMILQPNNSLNVLNNPNNFVQLPTNIFNSSKFAPNSTFNTKPTKLIPENILDLRKPNSGALDLRTTVFRCFQCTFKSKTILELNKHFKILHLAVLMNFKSFRIPATLYQRLLLNQFSTIVRTKSESYELFNSGCSCSICNIELPTRYEMIHHLGLAHRFDHVWVCLVCGYGCNQASELSQHFQMHSNLPLMPNQHHQSMVNPPPVNINNNHSMELSQLIQNSSTNNDRPNVSRCIQRHHTIGPQLASSTPIPASKRFQNQFESMGVGSFNNSPNVINNKRSNASFNHSNNSLPPNTSTSNDKVVLKCLVCDTTARWRSELFTHMITHSEHRSFGCKFCNYRSKWKWDVPKHLKRCRLAPAHVRQPDVQNSYLITLLQHYAPPPGDILHEFMKEYNIKDIGTLNRSSNTITKSEIDTSSTQSKDENNAATISMANNPIQAFSRVTKSESHSISNISLTGDQINRLNYSQTDQQAYSDITQNSDNSELDVGTDELSTVNNDIPVSSDHRTNTSKSVIDNSNDISQNNGGEHLADSKQCPWCAVFITNKTEDMIEHIRVRHSNN